MKRISTKAGVLASAMALLALPGAAMASGGSGGGGTNSGGVNDTTSTLSSGPCVKLANVSDPVGYFSTFAAIWHNYTVKTCSSVDQNVNVTVTDRNVATGNVDFTTTWSYYVPAGGKAQGMIDNDYAPFSTTYDIQTSVADANGNPLASQSVPATTPPPK